MQMPRSIRIRINVGVAVAVAVSACAAVVAVAAGGHHRVLHLRVATALIPPSGAAVSGGFEDVWVDWSAGTAVTHSLIPGDLAQTTR